MDAGTLFLPGPLQPAVSCHRLFSANIRSRQSAVLAGAVWISEEKWRPKTHGSTYEPRYASRTPTESKIEVQGNRREEQRCCHRKNDAGSRALGFANCTGDNNGARQCNCDPVGSARVVASTEIGGDFVLIRHPIGTYVVAANAAVERRRAAGWRGLCHSCKGRDRPGASVCSARLDGIQPKKHAYSSFLTSWTKSSIVSTSGTGS